MPLRLNFLLFDTLDAPKADTTLWLDPDTNRTFHYWHVFVVGLAAEQVYAYRVDGPYDPSNGLRFNPNKVLLDSLCACCRGVVHLFSSSGKPRFR